MSTLDTNVYKVPSFSKMGFEIQERKRKEMEQKLNIEGVEDSYMASKHLLQGDFSRDASLLHDQWLEAATTARDTRSEADLREAKRLKAELEYVIGAGKTQQEMASKAYGTALQNQFEGYAIPKEQIEKGYSDFLNRRWESKVENGRLMIKEGDTFVPFNQSSLYSSTPNPNNTYIIPKAVEQGKYVMSESFLNDYRNVTGASNEEKLGKIFSAVDYRINSNDLKFISDVAMHYEIQELGHFIGGYSAEDRRKAEKRYQEDPEYAAAAIESYKKDIEAKSSMYLKGTKEGYGNNPFVQQVDVKGSDSVDVAFIPLKKKTNGIVGLGQDIEGNYYKIQEMEGMISYQPATEAEVKLVEAVAGQMPQLFEKQEQTQEQPEQPADATNQITGEEVTESQTPELPEPVKAEEAQQTQGFGGLDLNIPSMQQTTGRAAPASEARALPDYYYENLIEFEGGVSTDKDDRAYALNPDAPIIDGKRAHTNRGVQYGMFKNWASKNNIPEKEYKERFLKLSEMDAIRIVDDLTSNAGLMNLEDPVLRSLFAQNLWGTGKVWAADFKKGRSSDYRSILDWLQGETGLDFANTSKMSKEEAEAIQKLYDKDPKKFINQFVDKKKTYFATLDTYDKFGKGWERRAEDLRDKALASV